MKNEYLRPLVVYLYVIYVTSRLFNFFRIVLNFHCQYFAKKSSATKLEIDLELYFISAVKKYFSIVKDTQISLISPERPIGNMFMSDFSLLLSLFFISGKSYFPICHFLPAPN